MGATGIFFTACTLLFAQLSENARGTIGQPFTFLVAAYLLRAIGDVSNEILSWLSPFGWILGTEVYVNNIWWPIALTVEISFVLGASYGSVFGDLETFFSNIEMMTNLLKSGDGLSLTEQFLSMLMSVLSMMCTIPTLMIMLKLKAEEKRNRTEHLLSRAVSHTKVMGSYLFLSIVFGFVMLFLALIGLWSAASPAMEDPISFEMMFEAAMVYLPAISIMIDLAVLLIGLFPHLTGMIWLYLGYSFFVVYLGGLLKLPEWMEKLSPFGQIPQLPAEEMNGLKVSMLTCIAAILMLIGFIGYKKRDITG
ncbi:hypothetical protein [uncultured Metabacillus sp.]|uniref:ABC transporter permease n=1 Tax=uncultured Metabacillus sp. TaxID=2860135 RepID=UPI00262BA095|nr:hypothetical protein [uncultured Metabacillus sp.]